MNNFLALGALVASGWVISNALPPKPVVGLDASRSTTTAAPVTNSQTIVGRDILEARRAPVPLVRTVLPSIVISTSVEASTLPSEQKAQDEQKVQDEPIGVCVRAWFRSCGIKRVLPFANFARPPSYRLRSRGDHIVGWRHSRRIQRRPAYHGFRSAHDAKAPRKFSLRRSRMCATTSSAMRGGIS